MQISLIHNPQGVPDKLYNIVAKSCEFYKDQNGELYMVSYTSTGYNLRFLSLKDDTKRLFRQLFFDHYKKIAKTADILNTYETVCAVAMNIVDEVPVYTRLAFFDDEIYYDLCNQQEEVIKITKEGVSIITKRNIKGFFFNQTSSMNEQAKPVHSEYGIFDYVKENFNISEDLVLIFIIFVCTAFIPHIRHPILIVEGEKGAGKSTLMEKLLAIINPVKKDVFVLPSNIDGLITTLSNNYFSVFDNVGKLSDEFSNTLCQASTGGTLTKRKLYSDNDELSISIKRLVALNGINLEISQGDLLDRAILVRLDRISDTERRPNEEIDIKFRKCLPGILSDIFFIVSKALNIYPQIKLQNYPRMADFSRYGYAIAEAIGEGNGKIFIEQYKKNIKLAVESAIEENPLLECIEYIIDKEGSWQGTMTELLLKIRRVIQNVYIGKTLPMNFPKTANALSRKLNSYKHELANLGITLETSRSKERRVKLSKTTL